ncbi:hypothetical protein [Candidatus Villigracilis affinis]|uniref:hypothetical protein n=1 Tax=Candidatus Villigracilis affinis TaxID=3140682 RepID=UPI002A22BA43|nr:hypothetical protein [Anaerolineales bacterium]
MGNQYSFGNITGSNINIDSTLEQVTQNIGSTKNIDETVKKQLAELIDQLKLELQKAPPMNKEDAEAIAESAKALIEASTKSQPNKTTVRITAEGLKKAAENIAGVMPTVLTIASGIVKTVVQSRFSGGGVLLFQPPNKACTRRWGFWRDSQAFFYASAFFQSDGFAVPAPAQVTQTVRR